MKVLVHDSVLSKRLMQDILMTPVTVYLYEAIMKWRIRKMKYYVSPDKRSKKAQREYHVKQRRTWGVLNPVTRSVPSGKTYNRKKDKKRIGREFRDEFLAGLF